MILFVTGKKVDNRFVFDPINIKLKNNVNYKIGVISISFYLDDNRNSFQDYETLFLCSNLIDVNLSNMSRALTYFPFNKRSNWQYFKSDVKCFHNLHIKDLELSQFFIKRIVDNSIVPLDNCCIQLELITRDGIF